MHYDKLKMRYKDEYMKLILDKYKKVKEKIELPEINQIKKQVSSELNQIIDHGIGLTLLNEEEVIGFIGGYQVDELFGSDKGIYVPLSGHGIKDEKLYPKLYEKISDIWVSEGYTSHSITMFTLDENIIEWFWLGFGLRCVDSIRQVSSFESHQFDIREFKSNMKLSELTKEHQTHFNQAPLFMDVDRPDTREWEDAKVFVAYDKKPIGYIKLTKHAESFVSESDSVINITGAQVLNEYRGKGVAKALLAYSNDWAEKNGYQFLGVDFESFNPSGAGFWNKYFTPYTYSLTRRIDERILTNSNLGYGYKKTGGV